VAVRNPVAVGGSTAFLVSLAFVSANALFYQPQMHPSAFVSTRALATRPAQEAVPEHPHPEAAPREVRQVLQEEQASAELEPEATGSVPERGDSTVRAVQAVLSDLDLYSGPIDGMAGPQTNAAVETYRRIVGLEPGSAIDTALLHQLGLNGDSPARSAAADEADAQSPESAVQTASAEQGGNMIRRVQAGLKAFGNDGIEIDGVLGERTQEAIREFQSLFGLPVTGEPDDALITKMREIGLIG